MQPIFSVLNAATYTLLSVFGAIILSVFGYGFAHNWDAMMGSTDDPKDGSKVARVCYIAALSYVVLGVFCSSQLVLHRRRARGEIRL